MEKDRITIATLTPAKHILLASPPFYGQAIPLLNLGRKLSQHYRITFAVSETILTKIRAELNPSEHDNITFLGVNEDGPAESDRAGTSTESWRHLFLRICPGMKNFFYTLTRPATSTVSDGLQVDAAIVDNLLGGPAAALHERGIPYYLFNSARIWMTQAFLSLDMEVPENLQFKNALNFAYRSPGAKICDPTFEVNKDILLDNCQTIHLAQGIIFNSFREAEQDELEEVFQKFPLMKSMKLFFVGPLIDLHENFPESDPVLAWLNQQTIDSVIYVSFGSIAVQKPQQIEQIAQALLALKCRFVWSLPASQYFYLPNELRKSESEMFFITPWAPQKAVLAHPAVSVFISHCGWNSTMESLTSGVPIVAWPMFVDQMLNAEWMEKVGVGKVLQGTGAASEQIIPAANIALAVREVGGKNGVEEFLQTPYRTAAQTWQSIIRADLSPTGSSCLDLERLTRSFGDFR